MKKKLMIYVMSIIAVICCVVGGTFAWLATSTDPITNTFVIGDINITLTETTGSAYKMIPGNEISKDPKVTVKAGSEACWLFIKIEESTNLDSYIAYTVASGWTLLEEGVYYREVEAVTADTPFAVLTNDKVNVLETVTKEMMNALEVEGATQPTLTFTAYAVQKANIATAADAWAKANA